MPMFSSTGEVRPGLDETMFIETGGYRRSRGLQTLTADPVAPVHSALPSVSPPIYLERVAFSGAGMEVAPVLADVTSVALVGTEARRVQVEVHIGQGLPSFNVVGLPARSIREAEHRTQAAIAASGEGWPRRKKIASLAPGALRKDGTHFDLPLALGVVAADERLPQAALREWVVMGELGLDGSVRGVPGVIAGAMVARDLGLGIMCPASNAVEAALVEGVSVAPVSTLREVFDLLRGEREADPVPPRAPQPGPGAGDLSEVRGQPEAKRAAEIAAAGGHNLLLEGPPGSGKTMLASRMPSILPALTNDEALEVTRIYSVAGLLGAGDGLISVRPFRLPHHHTSLAGLIGGGTGLPRPGEVSLAHQGILFLDELTLYRREVLEALRGPLEDGRVRLARSGGAIDFPCSFSLVAAMNPCPCGYLTDPVRSCRCGAHDLERYAAKLSGPLLDRVDMRVEMQRLTRTELLGARSGESSELVRARVEAARAIQRERYAGANNASADRCVVRRAELSQPSLGLLGAAIDAYDLSGRGVDRVVRVARTIADLDGSAAVSSDHMGEALTYRLRDAHSEVAA